MVSRLDLQVRLKTELLGVIEALKSDREDLVEKIAYEGIRLESIHRAGESVAGENNTALKILFAKCTSDYNKLQEQLQEIDSLIEAYDIEKDCIFD